MFPAKYTVVVMDDYNSLDSDHGFQWKAEADGLYLEFMKRLRRFRNVVYMLPTDGPRFEMPQAALDAANT
eukprot:2588653-Lingulodinium_polyedra.AAC.1